MAFEAIASLNKTPLRVTTTGGDTAGLGVMAGRDLKELRIVISNYEIDPSLMGPDPFPDNTVSWPGVGTFTYIDRQSVTYQNNNGYDLTIRDIPASWRDVTIERSRIDATSELTLISSSTVHPKCKAPLTLSATMPAPAVELIVVKSAR